MSSNSRKTGTEILVLAAEQAAEKAASLQLRPCFRSLSYDQKCHSLLPWSRVGQMTRQDDQDVIHHDGGNATAKSVIVTASIMRKAS